jgi:hypothetical protein
VKIPLHKMDQARLELLAAAFRMTPEQFAIRLLQHGMNRWERGLNQALQKGIEVPIIEKRE